MKEYTNREIMEQMIGEAIGYYAGTIMVENPKWVFDADKAEVLALKIMAIADKYYKP